MIARYGSEASTGGVSGANSKWIDLARSGMSALINGHKSSAVAQKENAFAVATMPLTMNSNPISNLATRVLKSGQLDGRYSLQP